MSRKNSKKLKVYYLPVTLTQFQKDLSEILISLHAISFKTSIAGGLQANSSNKSDDSSANHQTHSYPRLSERQLTYIFDSNIRAIANHPSLLVDHYMPRQLLRMEPTESSIAGSHKFQVLNHLINSLCFRDKVETPNKVIKCAIIAHSIKELDLLEGLVLGKKFRIKRLSGTSLYNEKHKFPTLTMVDSTTNKDGTPNSLSSTSSNSNSTSYTGYSKDDYDYSVKRNLKKRKFNNEDWLFLATTKHLKHDPCLLANYDLDVIISFDPMLYIELPALQLLKNSSNKTIPIIKLLVQNSPDHYLLDSEIKNSGTGPRCVNGEDHVDDDSEYEEMKSSLLYFLQARNSKVENFNVDYAALIQCCLQGKDCNYLLPTLDLTTLDETSKDLSCPELWQPRLTALHYCTTKLPLWDGPLDIKSYQTELMHRAVIRLRDTQDEYEKGTAPLNEKRFKENQRQNKLDEIKHSAGVTFKKKQDLDKSINDSEKRYRHAMTESAKLDTKLNALLKIKLELENFGKLYPEVTSSGDHSEKEPALTSKLNEYIVTNVTLTETLKELEEANAKKSEENDELRSQYQIESSKAAESAQTVKTLQESMKSLENEMNGPLTKFSTQSLKKELECLRNDFQSLKSRNKFLKDYINSMNRQYDLKNKSNVQVEKTAATGTRFRSTRSNTPNYT
ncbi:hda2p [Saccharomyces arboricola H-6]|uniref:Hda2p n=1 Tax=Saccharomyces arboricola (strain H-6 / AS 2.3317 / CBS 10644) TaxID=1160507 RepID=J8LJN2_SACAR|nr:hda2p [Saccharomyces arboricola H-6]